MRGRQTNLPAPRATVVAGPGMRDGGGFAPIIVAGMHRSGTSMIARILERFGLFVGCDLEENHESRFFIRCNDWLLARAGGSWTQPAAMAWLRRDEETLQLCCEYLAFLAGRLPARGYLGWRRWLRRERPLPGLHEPWGWKDPRNTFTLPVWLRLFPDARIVHIYRNGVAVAASLREAARRGYRRGRLRHERRMRFGAYRWTAKGRGFGYPVRCLDLAGAFSLWEEYVAEARRVVEDAGQAVFTVGYEEFLADPAAWARKLAAFCGLRVEEDAVRAAAAGADSGNATRFLQNPEVSAFHERMRGSPWMTHLGYGSGGPR